MATWPYNLPAYQRARRYVLARDPWCSVEGCTNPSTSADHVVPVVDLIERYGGQQSAKARAMACDPALMRGTCLSHNSSRGARLGNRRRSRPQ